MNYLNIIQFNIRSLKNKFNEFSAYLAQNQIDVALLSETWLTEKDENIYLKHLKDYNYFMEYSKKQGYRGVGILIKKSLNAEKIDMNIELEKIELIAVKLIDENLYFLSTYIPDENNEIIRNDLENISPFLQNKLFIYGGDVNAYHISWGSKYNNERGRIIKEFINNNFLHTLNDGENTRMSSSNDGSAIDITFADPVTSEKCEWKITSESLGSDHLIIAMKLNTSKKYSSNKKYVKILKNHKIIQSSFEELMREKKEFREVQNNIKCVIAKNTKKIHTKYIPKYWWNEKIAVLYESRKIKISQWRKNNCSEVMEKIMDLNKKIKNLIKEVKKEKSTDLVSKLNPRSNITEIFKTVKVLSGKVTSSSAEFNLVTENKANCINFLQRCFVEEFNSQPAVYEEERSNIINIDYLEKSLQRKNNKSSAGADGITYKMLKDLSPEATENYVEFLNQLWCNGLNEDNKTIILKPIPKPKKNIHELKNYRALSMINTSVKIINEVVKNEIENHLKRHRLIPDLSFGFRKNHSTIDCLNVVIEKVKFLRRKNFHVAIISFDCEKAFDTVDIKKLATILTGLKIKKCHVEWIYNFMTNRKIIVSTKEGLVTFSTSTGVPQGDPISPCMFNAYTINIHKINDEKNCLLVQYADDFILIVFDRKKENLAGLIKKKGEEFVKRLKDKNINVNLLKTAVMLMNQHYDQKFINIDGKNVSIVDCITFLGIELDKKLNFSNHCEKMRTELDRRQSAFSSFMRIKDVSHPKILKHIFDAVIMGYIRYNMTIYTNAKVTNNSKIEPRFNSCLKKLNGLLHTTPTNTMSVIASSPPLWCEVKKEILKYILRIKLKNISTFKLMRDSLKDEIKLLEERKNAILIVREKDGYMAFEYHNDVRMPEHLKFHNYTVVERFYLSNLQEIDNWPTLKDNNTKKTLKIFDEIEGMSRKDALPSSSIKSIALASINEINEFIVYTDGSLMPSGEKGVGVYCSDFQIQAKVSKPNSSMSVELNALKIALEELWKNRKSGNVVLTDSKSACTLLKNCNDKDENETLIHEILCLMNITKTQIQWIPAHVGIDGNEKADKLAKNACSSSIHLYKREKSTVNDIKIEINKIIEKEWKDWYLQRISEGVGTKSFLYFKEPHQGYWWEKIYENLNGADIKIINRILSGHDLSPASRKKFNSENSDQCDLCNKMCDANHIIFECKKYKRKFKTTEKNVIEWIKKAKKYEIREIINFIIDNDIKL